jgi:hypothetical protein
MTPAAGIALAAAAGAARRFVAALSTGTDVTVLSIGTAVGNASDRAVGIALAQRQPGTDAEGQGELACSAPFLGLCFRLLLFVEVANQIDPASGQRLPNILTELIVQQFSEAPYDRGMFLILPHRSSSDG